MPVAIGADMADLAHKARREIATGDEADRPGRAEQAERRRREAFRLAAQGQDQAVQTRSGKQEGGAPEQRQDGAEGHEHQANLIAFEAASRRRDNRPFTSF
jgi:hypothetical protein